MSTSTMTVTHQGATALPLEPLKCPPTTTSLTSQHTTTTRERFPHLGHPSHDNDTPSPSKPLSTPILKLLSTGFCFFVAGINDGCLGALIPHLLRSYSISTALVSVLYAGTLAGWVVAAFTSTHLAQHLRLGALLALGATLQIVSHVVRCWGWVQGGGPPFGVFVVGCFVASLGQAWQDTWEIRLWRVSRRQVLGREGEDGGDGGEGKKKEVPVHRWLGFIHAMYMAGCLVAPFPAASIAASGRWWLFYAVPLGLGVMNLTLVVVAFRDSMGFEGRGRKTVPMAGADGAEKTKTAWGLIKDTLTQKSLWLLGVFFFFYLGVVVTAGGWVVEYLVDVRKGNITAMGYVPAGFSGGCLLGRILLPEPTHRFGEKKMVFLYCVLCLGFQLLFWQVPNIIAASVAISFLGFFSGPFFSTGISVGTRLFPPDISPTAISFIFIFAQTGGSLFPIVTGVLGARVGVSVMQPILVGLIVAMGASWLLVPQPKGKTN